MSDWITDENILPTNPHHIVLVTDGEIMALASYINDPLDWYGPELLDEDGEKIEDDLIDGHWRFETRISPFLRNDYCFGVIGDVIGWMPLPNPKVQE